jgi:hypothetical protein
MRTTITKPFGSSLLKNLLVILLLFVSANTFAQNTAGKDFWCAQTPNVSDKNGDIAILIANRSADVTATVTITNPARATVTRILPPNSMDSVFFTSENPNIQTSGMYVNNVYHIMSDNNIVAYSFTPWVNVISNDASLLFPTVSLGKKYFLGSYTSATPQNAFNSFFSIVATEDGTIIKVYDKTGGNNNALNNTASFTITLNKGQCYQYLNGNTLNTDVIGWYLESNKKIAVISGNQCTNIGSAASCDHIEDQVLPVETLATTYVASPSNTRPITGATPTSPDLFRFVATESGTTLTTNLNGTVYNLNKGQYAEIVSNIPFIVNSSKPIAGYQFFISQNSLYAGYQRPGIGDPDMIAMPVVDQFLYDYDFINSASYPYNFVNVVAPAGINLKIDGALISPNWITAGVINGIVYKSANIAVNDKSHKIMGDKRFGILVYGFGTFASFGYLGGSGMEPINAGCRTGGPYQYINCNNLSPVSIQLNGNPSCSDGSTPQIQWSSTDGVVFSNPNIKNPIATVPGVGTYNIKLSVNCGGNIVECFSEIIVKPPSLQCNIPVPTLVPPPAVIIPSNPGQSFATNVTIGTATYTAEGPAVLVNDGTASYPVGNSIVTWTVTDAYGRTASGTQTVTVVPPPSIIAPDMIVVATDPGESYATVTSLHAVNYWESPVTYWVYNNFSSPLSSGAPANNQYSIGDHTIAWKVIDQWGRAATGTQVVRVATTPPTIVAPPMVTVTAGFDGLASGVNLRANGNEIYTSTVNPSTVSNDGPASYPIGITNVTWTVTDGLGRTASDVQQVKVIVPQPTIDPMPDITVSNNPGQTYATGVNLGTPTFKAVGPYTLTNNAPANGQYPLGNTTVTWTLTDAYGNVVKTSHVVTVVSAPPTIVAPPMVTVTAGFDGLASGVNLRANGNETYTSTVNPSAVSNDGPASYPIGITNVTWTVTDGLGRTASDVQQVKVIVPQPTIDPMPDITVSNNPGATYATGVNLGTPKFKAVGPYTLTNDAPANGQYPLGNTTVTWTLTDAYGNVVKTSHVVTVVSAPPTIVAPPMVTVTAGFDGLASGINLRANGNESYTVSVTPGIVSNDGPASYPIGITNVTWTVTDGLGRTASDVQQVKVIVPQPTIDPMPDITVSNNTGQTYATGVNLGIPTFQAVGPYTLTNDAPSQFPLGNTTVTWTLTDAYGNVVKTSHVVTVVSAPPTIVPPPAITVTAGAGQTTALISNIGNATYTVSVNPATLTNDALPGNQYSLGNTTVTWTVKDGLGRKASGTQLISVLPSASCSFVTSITSVPTSSCTMTGGVPTNLFIGYGPQSTRLQVNIPAGTGYTYQWTGAGLSSTTSGAPIFAPTAEGIYTFTVSVKNSTGCISTSTIRICVKDIRVLEANGSWDGKKVYVCHLPPGNPPNVQTINISINAVDTHVPNHGGDQLGKCNLICELPGVDTLPSITAPPAITVNANAGFNYATGVALGNPTYIALQPATITNNAPAQFPVGNTTVTWTVTDKLGRTATGTQVVTVKPAPCTFNASITSVPSSTVNTGGNPNRLYLGYGAQSTKLQVNVPSGGTYTFTWTGSGLNSTSSAAPVFTPTTEGIYTFSVTVKNTAGCIATSAVSICVTDIRVLDNKGNWDGKKVYVCHLPPGNPANVQIINISINAVDTHVPNHGGDGLGQSCSTTCSVSSKGSTAPITETFNASVTPNPSSGHFILQVKSDDIYTKVSVRIMDAFGRTVQVLNNVTVNQATKFGEKFASGAYYAEVLQGSDRKVIQLVKAK